MTSWWRGSLRSYQCPVTHGVSCRPAIKQIMPLSLHTPPTPAWPLSITTAQRTEGHYRTSVPKINDHLPLSVFLIAKTLSLDLWSTATIASRMSLKNFFCPARAWQLTFSLIGFLSPQSRPPTPPPHPTPCPQLFVFNDPITAHRSNPQKQSWGQGEANMRGHQNVRRQDKSPTPEWRSPCRWSKDALFSSEGREFRVLLGNVLTVAHS